MPRMTSPQGEELEIPDGPGVRSLHNLGWTTVQPTEPAAPAPAPKKAPAKRKRAPRE